VGVRFLRDTLYVQLANEDMMKQTFHGVDVTLTYLNAGDFELYRNRSILLLYTRLLRFGVCFNKTHM